MRRWRRGLSIPARRISPPELYVRFVEIWSFYVIVVGIALEIFLPILPFFHLLLPFFFPYDDNQDKQDNSLAAIDWGMIYCKERGTIVLETVLDGGWDWIVVNGWCEISTLSTSYHQLPPPAKTSALSMSSNAPFEQTDKANLPWNAPWRESWGSKGCISAPRFDDDLMPSIPKRRTRLRVAI